MLPILKTLRLTSSQSAEIQIECFLRKHIQSGGLPQETRIPTTPELAKEWSVSCSVVQKVMRHLVADGLIERRAKRGTFIKAADQTTMIGILFGPSLSSQTTYFYRAVNRAFLDEIERRNWQALIYDGLNDENGAAMSANSQVCRRLAGDIGRYAFNGLILFATNFDEIAPLKRLSALPRAHLATSSSLHDIGYDIPDFIHQSLSYLVERGFRKITYLSASLDKKNNGSELDAIRAAACDLGIPHPKVEVLCAGSLHDGKEAQWFQMSLKLIEQWRRNHSQEWPDAILISDDIAMRALAMALLASGVSVPDDVFVMTAASEGVNLHYGMPVVRYEYSPKEIACAFLDRLEKRLRGDAAPFDPVILKGKVKEPSGIQQFSHID